MIGIEFESDEEIESKELTRVMRIVEWQMRKDYFIRAITGIKDGKKIGIMKRLSDLRYSLTRWELYHGNKGHVFLMGYGRTQFVNDEDTIQIHTPLFSIYYVKKGIEE